MFKKLSQRPYLKRLDHILSTRLQQHGVPPDDSPCDQAGVRQRVVVDSATRNVPSLKCRADIAVVPTLGAAEVIETTYRAELPVDRSSFG